MNKKVNKKIFSVIAVLAISATSVAGAMSLASCKHDNSGGDDPGDNGTTSSEKVYYVTADASKDGTGSSWDDPMTIYNVIGNNANIISPLQPGDTVYVKPGVYQWNTNWSTNTTGLILTASGTYKNYINIVNAAYDSDSGYTGTETEALLSFYGQNFASNARGVQIYGDYVYWYGIDICGAGDNGMYVAGNYNTIEFCEFYNNRDTGLQLGRAYSEYTTVDTWPNYNLIKNCTSHNNYDNETYGENADGFAAKLTVGYGNVFDGCIAYRNSDDGWDLYAKTDSGNIGQVIIYNCVAFENGYLEYTQQECNKLFPSWTGIYSEADDKTGDNLYGLNSYKTRDGDGNGFKLGGSVMEGDVLMYNCLSFNNRMHGVTDNSNPGVLSVNYTTSYNNSGAVDDDSDSDYFGYIMDIANSDTHGNIDVSRQSYSYNNISNVLAVKDSLAKSLENDAVRGSATDSILGSWKINGSIDADTKNGVYGESVTAPSSGDIFEKLPFTKELVSAAQSEDEEDIYKYTFNMTGVRDTYSNISSQSLSSDRIHLKYRNGDHSINMGDMLAVKDYSILLGNDTPIGSVLNLTSYDKYTHFYGNDFTDATLSSSYASIVARAKETLTINCNLDAVYQDFDLPSKLTTCSLSWESSNESVLSVGNVKDISLSKSEYYTVEVNRPLDKDVQVTLTATITCGNATDKKEFVVTVKAGTPTIGSIFIITQNGEVVTDGSSVVTDMYDVYGEPVLYVENGIDYNGKLLSEELYEVESIYMYAENANSAFVEIGGFSASTPGVYMITKNVTMGEESASLTYYIYVADKSAAVDFVANSVTVTVNRHGYVLAGQANNATGYLYAISSKDAISGLTAEALVATENVEKYEFRGINLSYQFTNENMDAYHIYYVLSNINCDKYSSVYEASVNVVEISDTAMFMNVARGGGSSATTIYKLTQDLDFTGVTYSTGTKSFTGLLNGMGYTVKNVTVDTGSSNYASLFYKVEGGTIENIKFDNISIKGAQTNGIVSRSNGGYFYNIQITNINVEGTQRVAALIGQAYEGAVPTSISQVSVVNAIPELNADGTIKDTENAYIISVSSNRAAGIIGLIQAASNSTNPVDITIDNCYVSSYIVCGTYSASAIVAEDDNKNSASHTLDISYCVSASVIVSLGTSSRLGGIVGYQTGTDALKITNCASIGQFYYSGVEVIASQKNLSGIMGNFNLAAPTTISGCASLMEEYNTDYQEGVTVYSKSAIAMAMLYTDTTRLGFDLDLWTLNYLTGSTTTLGSNDPDSTAPSYTAYLTLNFLGDWTAE